MFTGIIEEVGRVIEFEAHETGARLTIGASTDLERCDSGSEHCGEWNVPDGGGSEQ